MTEDNEWFKNYYNAHKAWSEQPSPRGFGPGDRTEGVLRHIEAELDEVRKEPFGSPERLTELCDIMILTIDAMWRNGYPVEQVCSALAAKQARNKRREWPAVPLDAPSFHVRKAEA